MSINAIAQQTGLDRKTVRKYLKRGLEGPSYCPRAPRPRLLEPFEDYLSKRIRAGPGLSGRRLFRDVCALGLTGGYTILTNFLRTISLRSTRPFERQFETCGGAAQQIL
ncbi:hypothetical protein [Roseibium sp.]|uniref:hypothetical protein n=1 Tax=Roseibium sp. TaxID=1936156 RepID=UPI003B504BF9